MKALLSLLAVVLGLAAGPASGSSRTQSFRLPDGSAACSYRSAGVLACRSTAVRSALVLSAKGAPRAVTMDVAWDASTPVLTRFERGGISCSVVSAAILCRNRSGYTISLGRHRIGAAG